MNAQHRPYPRFWPLILALALAELTCSLESSMIYVALSPLYKQYGDPVRVGWLLTAFTLVSAGSAAVCGRLGDLFGRRRVLLVMLGIATAGSILSAVSPDFDLVIVGRGLQGASMAVLPLCFGLLRENCSERDATRAVGLLGGTYALGSGLGVVIGGVVIDHFRWQSIFVVSAAVAVLALVAVAILVPISAQRRTGQHLDVLGGVLFAPAIAAILLALTLFPTLGIGAAAPLALLIGGLVLFALWVRHELVCRDPLIDVRLLGDKRILWANVSIFFTALGPMMVPIVMMPMLQQPIWTGIGFGVSAAIAGLIKLPANLTSVVAAMVGGQLAARYGIRQVLMVTAAVLIAGWFAVAAYHGSLVFVALLMVVALVPGATLLFSMIPRIVMQAAPDDRTSEATGVTQVVRALGQALSAQLMAFLLATSMVGSKTIRGAFPSEAAYVAAFVAMAILSAAALAALFWIPHARPDPADRR